MLMSAKDLKPLFFCETALENTTVKIAKNAFRPNKLAILKRKIKTYVKMLPF
jgi:hypothetical protein